MPYSSGAGEGGVIPHPIPEVNFLMVEIPVLKPYIFMIRVNRQIKCSKSCGAGSSPSSTGSFFENYTYLWNHFVNFNQTLPKCSLHDPLPKLCSVCLGSKEGPKRGPKMINYFNIQKSFSCEPAMPEDWYLAHNIDKSWKQESSLTKWI